MNKGQPKAGLFLFKEMPAEVKTIDLRDSRSIQLSVDKLPILILLAREFRTLTLWSTEKFLKSLGKSYNSIKLPADIKEEMHLEDFIIINGAYFKKTGHRAGYRSFNRGDSVILGRTMPDDLDLRNVRISPHHLRITSKDETLNIEDLGSPWGSMVAII